MGVAHALRSAGTLAYPGRVVDKRIGRIFRIFRNFTHIVRARVYRIMYVHRHRRVSLILQWHLPISGVLPLLLLETLSASFELLKLV